MSKVVSLLSGGLDSTTLLYDLIDSGHEVHPISFYYRQKHNRELDAAMLTCSKLGIKIKVVDLSILSELAPSALTRKDWKIPEGHYEEESMKQTVVPNRNMVLISLAVSYAIGIGASDVYYGAHGGDHAIYPDCRSEFIQAMRKSILLCDWSKITLKAPYLSLTKIEILKRGIELKVDFSKTWTCYLGEKSACGKCGSCQERLEAFATCGVKDPIQYEGVE